MFSPIMAEPDGALLDKMNADDFEIRNKAYLAVREWAQKNLESSPEKLHRVWRSSKQPEVRTRCFELMKEMAIQRKFGKGRGFIGIRMQETRVQDPGGKDLLAGVQVSQVMPETPGEKAGLKMNDIILGVDKFDFGKAQAQPQQRGFGFQLNTGVLTRFGDYIQSKQPDETITLHILRQGNKMDIKVKLMKRPASADIDAFGGRQVDRAQQQKAYFDEWLKSMTRK
ncbi:MAG: PDZ domain-containing protein [Akkermansiaceae bacterium]